MAIMPSLSPLLVLVFVQSLGTVAGSLDCSNTPSDVPWNLCDLALSPGARVYTITDQSYKDEVTQRWTVYDPPTSKAAVQPVTEDDVMKIVTLAGQKNISILATGGGHGFATTFSNLQEGLQIDLSLMKEIDVDLELGSVTVGGGVLTGEVIESLFANGKVLPTGSESCIGLVGSTLGGGIGRLSGLNGLVIDALLSVRIVTASGEAANGGEVTNADFLFRECDMSLVSTYFKSMEASIPAELALILAAGYMDNTDEGESTR
ncbi:hypothetical protein GGR57DRAFT_513846 [Xylariaceae sp. FL1272]|nr:hypothetical protein GGR57DRAFT_513846 [Xylariaceae sp. FL1272]